MAAVEAERFLIGCFRRRLGQLLVVKDREVVPVVVEAERFRIDCFRRPSLPLRLKDREVAPLAVVEMVRWWQIFGQL